MSASTLTVLHIASGRPSASPHAVLTHTTPLSGTPTSTTPSLGRRYPHRWARTPGLGRHALPVSNCLVVNSSNQTTTCSERTRVASPLWRGSVGFGAGPGENNPFSVVLKRESGNWATDAHRGGCSARSR